MKTLAYLFNKLYSLGSVMFRAIAPQEYGSDWDWQLTYCLYWVFCLWKSFRVSHSISSDIDNSEKYTHTKKKKIVWQIL